MGNTDKGTPRLKTGLAEMLKGGVIMDVVNADQARIAEAAGAVAVMALERVPADIRRDGGVARMSPVSKIREIQEAVSIPVMAKCRIGHLAEARVLEALKVDFIDESEVLTPADEENHVYKNDFTVPFVCGCRNLGEALRRIGEGAAMIRTKGEAGTGDIVHAVKHLRQVHREIRMLTQLSSDELMATTPWRDTAPYEGLKPTTPHMAAGWRMEPPVSEPSAQRASPAATAAAEPPLEPPGTVARSQGLRVGPKAEFSHDEPMANSSMLALPSITTWSPNSFLTAVAV